MRNVAGARLTMAVEDHARGTQNLHFRTRFQPTRLLVGLGIIGGVLASALAAAGFWPAAAVISALLLGLAGYARTEWQMSAGQIGSALDALRSRGPFFETQQPDRTLGSHDTPEAMHNAAE